MRQWLHRSWHRFLLQRIGVSLFAFFVESFDGFLEVGNDDIPSVHVIFIFAKQHRIEITRTKYGKRAQG
jgi:hypothetical protein